MSSNGKDRDPLELFIKLLGMTSSDNDNMALVACRKVNQYLRDTLGSDWESFVRGKIKVEADPFAAAPMPTPSRAMNMGASSSSAPPPIRPTVAHHNGPEIQQWIDKLELRTLPSYIQRRLNDIGSNWGRNGYLLQSDYEELRRLANQKKRYRP